jgi:hypothetical protein
MKDPNEIVLWILEIQDEWINEQGIKKQTCVWKIAGKNVNLGSILKPNQKIKRIKYAIRGINIGDIFS